MIIDIILIEESNTCKKCGNNFGFMFRVIKNAKFQYCLCWDCFLKEINFAKNSIISKLPEKQHFYITLISQLNNELVSEQIITKYQKKQIEDYIQNKITNY